MTKNYKKNIIINDAILKDCILHQPKVSAFL